MPCSRQSVLPTKASTFLRAESTVSKFYPLSFANCFDFSIIQLHGERKRSPFGAERQHLRMTERECRGRHRGQGKPGRIQLLHTRPIWDSIRAFQKLLPPCLPRRKPPVCSQAQTSVSWIRRLPEGGSGRAESPQCARRRTPLPPQGLTRRLRRGRRACSLHGGTYLLRRRSEGVQGASGKPPCLHEERQLCRKKFPFDGA